MKHSTSLLKVTLTVALLAGICLLIQATLTAQQSDAGSAPAASTKPGAKIVAPEVDREALRKEAHKRREAERVFDETQGPTNPFLREDFPEAF